MAKGSEAATTAEAKTEETPAATPAAAPAAPAGAAPAAAQSAAAPEKPAKQERTYTKAEMDAAAQKAAADALKKAEAEKDLSELERANNRIKELEAQNRLRDARDAVTDALSEAGARSPELIWKALQGDLEFDDKGGLKNLDTLVNNFKSSYPEQFGVEKPSETINGGAGGDTATTLTMEQIQKMTPDQINERNNAEFAIQLKSVEERLAAAVLSKLDKRTV